MRITHKTGYCGGGFSIIELALEQIKSIVQGMELVNDWLRCPHCGEPRADHLDLHEDTEDGSVTCLQCGCTYMADFIEPADGYIIEAGEKHAAVRIALWSLVLGYRSQEVERE